MMNRSSCARSVRVSAAGTSVRFRVYRVKTIATTYALVIRVTTRGRTYTGNLVRSAICTAGGVRTECPVWTPPVSSRTVQLPAAATVTSTLRHFPRRLRRDNRSWLPSSLAPVLFVRSPVATSRGFGAVSVQLREISGEVGGPAGPTGFRHLLSGSHWFLFEFDVKIIVIENFIDV